MLSPFDTSEYSTAAVIVSHPDDEVLMCGGTIKRISNAGMRVHVVCLSDGAQGRGAVLEKACAILGASAELRECRVNGFRADGDLVRMTDQIVDEWRPDVLITHGPGLGQSQDHRATCQAVRTTVSRRPWPKILLLGSPPLATTDFAPTFFVDVTQAWPSKAEALDVYREILDREYMAHDYLGVMGAWWAQVSGRAGRHYEAFYIDLWRPELER